MVWSTASGFIKNIKTKMFKVSLVAGLIAALAVPSLTPLLKNSAYAETTVNSQAELVAAIASSESVINIGSDFSLTSQVDINRTLTLNGNGRTISTSYTGTGGGNDTALAVVGGNPTINNLVIDGSAGVATQGIQVWQSSATLNNTTSKNNDKAGIHVNGSTVTIFNATTSNNGENYGGIMISGGTVTINGTSTHSENINWTGKVMDLYRTGGTVNDTNSQYNDWYGVIYTLKPVVDAAKPTVSNISIAPTINGNIGRTVTVRFDLNDATGVDLTKTRVLFADGPNLPGRSKESSKYTPILVSGNTFQVVIDTTSFLSQNYTGNYSLNFNLYDTLGNHGSSKPKEFRPIMIDNSGPFATLTYPISGSAVNSTQRLTFSITDHTGVASAYMKLNGPTGSKSFNLTQGSGSEWYADVDTSTLADGNYTIDVRPIDVFGTPRYNANRGNVTIDNSAPVWDLSPVHISPIDDSLMTEGGEILMQWSDATDSNGVKYFYEVSSTSDQTTGPDNRFTDPIQWLFGPLGVSELNATGTAVGTYYWHVKACDDLGNCTPWTEPWTGTVEAPQSPAPATLGQNTDDQNQQNNNRPTNSSRSTGNNQIQPAAPAQLVSNNNSAITGNNRGEDQEENSDQDVAGATIENDLPSSATLAAATANLAENSSCSKILGLCWYYWPPIVVGLIILGYLGFARRQIEK